MELRYGLNPDQEARMEALDSTRSPIRVVSGNPSYVNVLDALSAWQLVREASSALGTPVATSFKHVSPAGAAVAGELDEVMVETWGVDSEALSPIATAYIRARDCDPKSAFGDFVAVTEPVDVSLAHILDSVVSDGVIAPGFAPGVVEMLAAKKRGTYVVMEVVKDFSPPVWERREVFGLALEQERSRRPITREVIRAGSPVELPARAELDLVLASVTARYTQSNSVTYAKNGAVLGIGAGQQSRVDCTKLAGAKLDVWWLRRHPVVSSLAFRPGVRRQERINWRIRFVEGDLTPDEQDRMGIASSGALFDPLSEAQRTNWRLQLDNVVLASDGFIPFRDNIDQAARHGARYVAHQGGSARSNEVEVACADYGIVLVNTGLRLFHH